MRACRMPHRVGHDRRLPGETARIRSEPELPAEPRLTHLHVFHTPTALERGDVDAREGRWDHDSQSRHAISQIGAELTRRSIAPGRDDPASADARGWNAGRDG